MKKNLLIFTVVCLLTSCAGMIADMKAQHEKWLAANCNTDAAYSNGVEDAQNGKEHKNSEYNDCPKDSGAIKKAYSEGFTSVTSNPLNILKDVVTGSYYECEVSAFTSTFTGSDQNLGRAKHKAIEKCIAQNHEMHCSREPKCKKL